MSIIKPHHLYLFELIEILESYPYPDKVIPIGFNGPHSYRGNYHDLAFEVTANTTPGSMLKSAKEALNSTYTGYKGGDFTMGKYTPCWMVEEYGDIGETLGALLLDCLLNFPSN